MKTNKKLNQLTTFFCCIGLLIIAIAIVKFANTAYFMSQASQVNGTVIGFEKVYIPGSSLDFGYAAVIEFRNNDNKKFIL